MADKFDIHVQYRPKDSASAPACAVTYKEDWAEQKDDDTIGSVNCSALSSDLGNIELKKQGGSFVLRGDKLSAPVTFDPAKSTYIVITPDAGKFAAKIFPDADAAKKYLETQRAPEVVQTTTHTTIVKEGPIVTAEVGAHGSLGSETPPYKTSDLRGIPTYGEESAFTGGGADAAIRFNFPHNSWGRWIGWFKPSLQGAFTEGTVNNHYTGRGGETGSWRSWYSGAFVGLQIDAQLFSEIVLPWNIFLRYDTPLIAARSFFSNAATGGHSMPVVNDFVEAVTPFDLHMVTAGFAVLAGKNVRLGLNAFARWLPVDRDGLHLNQDDYGGQFTVSVGNYSSEETTTTTTPGAARVVLLPAEPTVTAAPPPPAEDAPPPPSPPPAPKDATTVALPPKQEFTVAGGATFAQGKSVLTKEGRAQVAEIAGKIGTYYQDLIRSGFPPKQPIYVSVEGYTNSDGSDTSNQSLSERRAAAFLTELKAVIAKRKKEAQKKNLPAPFPSTVVIRSKGYGETELVMGPEGKEDKAASRRVVVRVLNDRVEFDKALPPVETPVDVQQADETRALELAAKLAKPKGPITRAFYHKGSNTLNLVVPVAYTSDSEGTGKKVRATFDAVYKAVRGQIKIFKLLSRNVGVQVIIAPSVPAISEDVASARKDVAKNILFKFGQWPVQGGSEVLSLAKGDDDPVKFVEELGAQRAGAGRIDTAALDAIIGSKVDLDVGDAKVALYIYKPEISKGDVVPDSRKLLAALARKVIKGNAVYYIEFYYPPRVKGFFDPEKIVKIVGNTVSDTVKTATGLFSFIEDERTPLRLYIAVANTPVDQKLLHDAIFRVALPKE